MLFAKIAKTFVELSATIIATRRRPILILHLEAKYAKINCKMKSTRKTEQGAPGLQKVNSEKKSIVNNEVKVNGQLL